MWIGHWWWWRWSRPSIQCFRPAEHSWGCGWQRWWWWWFRPGIQCSHPAGHSWDCGLQHPPPLGPALSCPPCQRLPGIESFDTLLNYWESPWNGYLLPERGVVVKAKFGISSVHLEQESWNWLKNQTFVKSSQVNGWIVAILWNPFLKKSSS